MDLSQDQINAGWALSESGQPYWTGPGLPIATLAGALIGLVMNGLGGALIGGGLGYVVGREFRAAEANSLAPPGAPTAI